MTRIKISSSYTLLLVLVHVLVLQLLSTLAAAHVIAPDNELTESKTTATRTTTTTRTPMDWANTIAKSLRAGQARSLVWGGPLDQRYKSDKISEEDKKALGLYPPDYDFVDENGVDKAAMSDTSGTLAIVENVTQDQQADQVMSEVQDKGQGKPSRRKFVSYTPSKWEAGWAAGIEQVTQDRTICETLLQGKHQKIWLHNYLSIMCPARAAPPNSAWCYFHDHNHFVWYNTNNNDMFELYIDKTPLQLDGTDTPVPTLVNTLELDAGWEEVASKFTFLDEVTGDEYYEYIEPLVAHLQFPLAGCLERKPLLADFASFILPPPSLSRVDGRVIMYDMGSADWSRMEYIVEEWGAHDAGFTYLITYAPSENEKKDAFIESVPEVHKSHIYRHYMNLVDHPTTDDASIFLPTKIGSQARDDDYIMVKFDRKMNAAVKQNLVAFILENNVHVNELFWEINSSDNYVMQGWYDTNLQFDELSSISLPDAYALLTELRNRGIRAHSWI